MNSKKIYFSIPLFYLFFANLLIGQSNSIASEKKSNWSVHIKYGVPLFERPEATFNNFETFIIHLPILHTTVGLGFQFQLTNHIMMSTEFSYEHGHFLKYEGYKHSTGKSNIRERFQTHSLTQPLKLNFKAKWVSFSAGLAYVLHFSTKVSINRSSLNREIIYKDGDDYILSSSGSVFGGITVDLDRNINFQALIGIQVHLRSSLFLDLEVKQYLIENIMTMIHNNDTGGFSQYYNPYPRLFSIGLVYFI